jgi:hypothetical protein
MKGQINTRQDLAKAAWGTAVELGVAKGEFSEEILRNPNIERLYSIDRWGNDGQHNDAEYMATVERLEKYEERSIIIRRPFDEAVQMFNPVFDFIYIDGYAHTGQEGGKTLEQWWPLLKPLGIFAGHDYHSKWPLTVEEVDKFVEKNDLKMYTTNEFPSHGPGLYPSWYLVKPER